MKEKLLELIDMINSDNELSALFVSLTINYKNRISDFGNQKFSDSVRKIISDSPKINSFNLTLYDTYPNERTESDYNKFWYDLKYIFYGKKKININFSFLSSQVHKQILDNDITFKGNFTKIKKIGDVYRTSAKLIYKTLKSKQ